MKKHLKAFPKFFAKLSLSRKIVLILVALAILAYFVWGIIFSKGIFLIAIVALGLFSKGFFVVMNTLVDYFETVNKNK